MYICAAGTYSQMQVVGNMEIPAVSDDVCRSAQLVLTSSCHFVCMHFGYGIVYTDTNTAYPRVSSHWNTPLLYYLRVLDNLLYTYMYYLIHTIQCHAIFYIPLFSGVITCQSVLSIYVIITCIKLEDGKIKSIDSDLQRRARTLALVVQSTFGYTTGESAPRGRDIGFRSSTRCLLSLVKL